MCLCSSDDKGRDLLEEQRLQYLALQEQTERLSLTDVTDEKDEKESTSSHASTKTIIPEAERVSDDKVVISVGPKKIEIDLSCKEKFDAKKTDAHGQKTIFENQNGTMSDNESLPPRKPVFLGIEEGDECHSITGHNSNTLASGATVPDATQLHPWNSPNSCDSSQNLSGMENGWSPSDPWSVDSQPTPQTGCHESIFLSSASSAHHKSPSQITNTPPAPLPVNNPSHEGPAPRPKKGSERQLQELLRRQPMCDTSKEQLQIALSQIAVSPEVDDDDDEDTIAMHNHLNCKSLGITVDGHRYMELCRGINNIFSRLSA